MLATFNFTKVSCGRPPLDSITHLRLLDIYHNPGSVEHQFIRTLLRLTHLTMLEVEGEIVTDWVTAANTTVPALQTLKIRREVHGNFPFQGLYDVIDAPRFDAA